MNTAQYYQAMKSLTLHNYAKQDLEAIEGIDEAFKEAGLDIKDFPYRFEDIDTEECTMEEFIQEIKNAEPDSEG